jgi:hypothetical protein
MSFFTTPTGTFFTASFWPKANLAPLPPGSSSLNWWQDVDANNLRTALTDTWAWVNSTSGTVTNLSSAFYPLSASFVQLSNSFVVVSSSYKATSASYVQTSAALSGFLNTSYPAFQSQMVALSTSFVGTSASYVAFSASVVAQLNAVSASTITALSQTVYDSNGGLSASMWGFVSGLSYTRGFYHAPTQSGSFYGLNLRAQRIQNMADPVSLQDAVTLNYLNSVPIGTAATASHLRSPLSESAGVLGRIPQGLGRLVGAVHFGNTDQLLTTDAIAIFYSDNFTNPQLSIGADGEIRDLDGTGIILLGSASSNPNVTLDNQILRASGLLLGINNSGTQKASVDYTGKAFFSGADMRSQKITNLGAGTTTGDAINWTQFNPVSAAFASVSSAFVDVSSSYVVLSAAFVSVSSSYVALSSSYTALSRTFVTASSLINSGSAVPTQIYLKAPNGSIWKLEVDSTGVLSSSGV